MDDLISPATRNLLELFSGPLRDVRFPDADVERLSRAVDEAQAAHEALVVAQLNLDALREALADKQRAIGKQTERTVAYARIYAADRPELLTALDAIGSAPRRGRGRPRKDGSAPGLSSTRPDAGRAGATSAVVPVRRRRAANDAPPDSASELQELEDVAAVGLPLAAHDLPDIRESQAAE